MPADAPGDGRPAPGRDRHEQPDDRRSPPRPARSSTCSAAGSTRTSPGRPRSASSSGRSLGSRIAHRVDVRVLRLLFVGVLLVHGLQMAGAGARMTRPTGRRDLDRTDRPAPDRRDVPERRPARDRRRAHGRRPGISPLDAGRRRSTSAAIPADIAGAPSRRASCGSGSWSSIATPLARVAASRRRLRRGRASGGWRSSRSAILVVIAVGVVARRRGGALTDGRSSSSLVAFAGHPPRRRAVHQRHRVVRAQARAWPRAPSGRVLAAVGTALPETMIPLIAILFGGGDGGRRDRRRRDPGRAVHARDAGHVRDRRRGPRPARRRRDRRDACRVDARVLVHDMRVLRRRLRASRSGPPSCRPTSPGRAGVVAVVLSSSTRSTSASTSRPRPATATRGPRAAPPPPARPRAAPAHPTPPRLRIVGAPGRSSPSACIIVGAVALRRRRRATSPSRSASTRRCWPSSSRRSRPSCPRSSTASSGSARARTPWRWATSPARWSSRARSRPSVALVFALVGLGGRPAARCSPSRRPGSPSLSTAVIFLPLARGRPPARPRRCSSAALFYLVYLGLVVAELAGLRRPLRRRRRRLAEPARARCYTRPTLDGAARARPGRIRTGAATPC